MDMRPVISNDRKEVRVDYFPHRIRLAGRPPPNARARELVVPPTDSAQLNDAAHVEIVEPETVSTVVPVSE